MPANLAELLETALPVELRHIPQRIRDVADQTGQRAALVGGVPRDLLRVSFGQLLAEVYRGAMHDFDTAVEGDGIAFAYELVRRLPGRLVVNRDFGTASITLDGPVVVDVASARTEEYPSPGHLPVVELGAALEADLTRRDFTINAVAVSLGEDYGDVLDVVGGAGDIHARVLRTLHAASFAEDPTRLFRALRYSTRLSYDLEPVTMQQFLEGVEAGNIDALSPERVRHELELIAREPTWADVWQALHFSGLLHAVHPALLEVYSGWLPSDARALDIAIHARGDLLIAEGVEGPLLRTAWALGGVETEQLEAVGVRIGLYQRQLRWIVQARAALREADDAGLAHLPPSLASALLEQYARQSVVVALFTFQPRTDAEVELRRTMLRFLEVWSGVRSELSGEELLALGVPRGPLLSEVRSKLRYLRMDGIISGVDGERDYVREFARGLSDGLEPDGAGGEERPDVK